MLLIAESGSSETKWRLIYKNGKSIEYTTGGFNPVFDVWADFFKQVSITFSEEGDNIKHLFFYGSGCAKNTIKAELEAKLRNIFKYAQVEVNSDLLGAARSLFGNESGISCILGTGSSACYYDGKNIQQINPSLGYLIGDEGSGYWLGRQLLRDYFYNKMPIDIYKKFKSKFIENADFNLQSIYKSDYPNRKIASLTRILVDFSKTPYVYELLKSSFVAFFNYQINGFNAKKIAFCGSVAFFFQDVLKEVISENLYELVGIQKTAITKLEKYHTEYL